MFDWVQNMSWLHILVNVQSRSLNTTLMSRKMYSLFIPFNNTILIEVTLDMYLTVSNQSVFSIEPCLDQNSWASTVNRQEKRWKWFIFNIPEISAQTQKPQKQSPRGVENDQKGVLRNFTKFTGKHLCQGLFFNKSYYQKINLYLKRDSGTGVFL